MVCCSNCFQDTEIQAIIEGNKQKGDCDFCRAKDVIVYDITSDGKRLEELFEGLLDIYTPISSLPSGFPKTETDLIKNILYYRYPIFNLDSQKIYTLITNLCAKRFREQPELFDQPVGIREIEDKNYLESNSILRTHSWEDFVNGIKKVNRFHGNYINTEKLLAFLSKSIKKHSKGEKFYRSRICLDEKGFTSNQMGSPPDIKSRGGRVNPEGISILYLSDSFPTTFYEVRAGIYDLVTTGTFSLLKDIQVVDFTKINQLSPFFLSENGVDHLQYALNIEHLRKISQEISKPLRGDQTLEYLPTQYICDFIRSKGYLGIEYMSTMKKDSRNLAIFDEKLFKCRKVEVYDISSISYDYNEVKSNKK